jgi:hypothetical protein
MRPLSAADCFTPALERAKAILLPFNWRLWVKLGFVAALAEIGAQFMFPPTGGGSHSANSSGSAAGASLLAIVPLLIIFATIVCAIGLVLFYIGSRMQMVFMDIAATRQTFVAPLWQRHRFHVWRWIGVKLLFFFSIAVIVGLLIVPPVFYLIHSNPTQSTQAPSPAFLSSIFLIILCVLPLILLAFALLWLLRDFVLPFIVFQDATLKDSINYATDIVRREPGPVALYLLLKFALTLAASIAAQFAIFIAALAGGIPLAFIGGGLWLALRHADTPGTVLLFLVLGVLGLVFLVWIFFAVLCAVAATQLFLQSYALYFLGGRYPLLGNLLEPPHPGFAYPPPPITPPATPGWAPSI